MSDLNVTNLLKKCRVCMSSDSKLIPIFEDLKIFDKTLKIHELIQVICDIELNSDDKLSKIICYECVVSLTDAHKLRLKCQKTDQMCRELIRMAITTPKKYPKEHPISINIEPLMIEEDNILVDNMSPELNSTNNPDGTSVMDGIEENEEDMTDDDFMFNSDDSASESDGESEKDQLNELTAIGKPSKRRYTVEDKTCRLCKRVFSQISQLRSHLGNNHAKDNPFECELCKTSLQTFSLLKRHMEVYHVETTPECGICKKKYSTADMIVHMRSHTGERPYQCFYCKKQFVCKRKVLAHQRYICKEVENYYESRDKETSEEIEDVTVTEKSKGFFVCEITKRELMRAEQFRCKICKKKITSKMKFDQHKKLHDQSDGKTICYSSKPKSIASVMCEICGKKLSSTASYIMHKEAHPNEYPKKVDCSSCDRKFHTKQALNNHKLVSHNKKSDKIVCEICGQDDFTTLRERANHKVTEHPDSKPFVCKTCDDKFSDKFLLHEHYVKTHWTFKKHRCTICELEVPTKSKLQKHMVVHTGDKPYSCGICDRKFGHKSNLNAHNRKFHDSK